MIELTDEMRVIVLGWRSRCGAVADDVLTELLAVVERDYLRVDGVHRDGRICRPGNKCVYCTPPGQCGAAGPDGLTCERTPHTPGIRHAAHTDKTGWVKW